MTRRRAVLAVLGTIGVLAFAGGCTGSEGVTHQEACINGALFFCSNPSLFDA